MNGADLGVTAVVRLAMRMLARDWRAGEQRLLALAVIVAVASVTRVTFFAERVGRWLPGDASQLRGAVLVIVSDKPIADRFVQTAQRAGLSATQAVRFPSMTQFAGRTLLTEVKAIAPGYPLRGKLRIRSSEAGPNFEPGRIPSPGEVWVDDRLRRRLDLKIGSLVGLGRRAITGAPPGRREA